MGLASTDCVRPGKHYCDIAVIVLGDIMATGALVSTAIMAILLLAVSVAVMRAQGVRSYSHTLGAKARGVAGGVSQQSSVRVDLQKVAIVLAMAGFVAAAAVFGQDPMVFVAAIGVLVAGYFAWGIYYLGRSHGMGKAHAVGLSAWFFSILLAAGIGVKLLVA